MCWMPPPRLGLTVALTCVALASCASDGEGDGGGGGGTGSASCAARLSTRGTGTWDGARCSATRPPPDDPSMPSCRAATTPAVRSRRTRRMRAPRKTLVPGGAPHVARAVRPHCRLARCHRAEEAEARRGPASAVPARRARHRGSVGVRRHDHPGARRCCHRAGPGYPRREDLVVGGGPGHRSRQLCRRPLPGALPADTTGNVSRQMACGPATRISYPDLGVGCGMAPRRCTEHATGTARRRRVRRLTCEFDPESASSRVRGPAWR